MATTLYEPTLRADASRILQLTHITALRALKVRYRGTALGVLWSFMNPVLLTAVYTTIFGTAFAKYYEGSVVRYLLSAFVGLVVVTFFLNATGEALPSVVASGSLLNKIAVPPVIFPCAAVASNVFQHAVTTFPIVIAISLVETHDPLRAVLALVVLGALVLLVTGFSLGLAALFVFFRDLPHLWAIVGFILWLTSPLFYPIEFVPANVRPYYDLNPIGITITALREVTLPHGALRLHVIALAVLVGIVSLVLGMAFFRVTKREFMDLL